MAQMKFDPIKPLTDLEQIIAQVEAAKDVDRDARLNAKMFSGIADKFDEVLLHVTEGAGKYAKAGSVVSGVAEAANTARALAEALNPIAEVTWTKDQVDESLLAVRFFMGAGAYDGEQLARAQSVVEKAGSITKTRVGASTAPRGTAEAIEGRPEYVEVFSTVGDQPEKITRQRGNTVHSAGNVSKAIKGYLTKNEIQVTDEMESAIVDAVNESIKDGKTEVTVGDFALIRHAA